MCLVQLSTWVYCAVNPVIGKLDRAMTEHHSLICLPLEFDKDNIPTNIVDDRYPAETCIYKFLKTIVDISADHVCAFTLSRALFDQCCQPQGLFEDIIRYIHSAYPNIPIFLDCMGCLNRSTSKFLSFTLKRYQADGIFVNPHGNDEVLNAVSDLKDKVGVILVQSNSSCSFSSAQCLSVHEMKVEHRLLEKVIEKWGTSANLIPVVSAHSEKTYWSKFIGKIPARMPFMLLANQHQPICAEYVKSFCDLQGRGVCVCAVPEHIYVFDKSKQDWQESIKRSLVQFKDSINMQCV